MDAYLADLLADDVDAWTLDQIRVRFRKITAALVGLSREQRDVSKRYAEAEADYKRKYHYAHLKVCLDEPEWTVARQESWAQMEAMDEYVIRVALKEEKAALRSSIEALGEVLDILRSENKTLRSAIGGY